MLRVVLPVATALAAIPGLVLATGALGARGGGSSLPMEATVDPAVGAGSAPAFQADSVAVLWEPGTVRQGTIFRIVVSGEGEPLERVGGTFADERLHFQPEADSRFVALAAAPVDAEGEVALRLELHGSDGIAHERALAVPVAPGEYRMERLTVAPEFGTPQPPEIQRRINEESARAMAVSRGSHDTPRMWEAPFVAPRESRITSGFGHGRMFNDQVQSRHMGTDFAGAVGTPVLAPARGVVALVDSFYLGGNVIYIDHGAGLVTAYLHLSGHEVEEGDEVEPGQVIGRVGATGRVTGPHLHWIVRYGEITVDGMSLLEIH